jgi:multidrug resistance efflux pump
MMTELIQANQTYREELISDEVQEVISYRPHWIIRKGNAFFLLILLFLLSLTWFIKYPDIINGSARLLALNPPKLIISKTEGKLIKLFVSNEEWVQKNQHLACLESTADYNQVMRLKKWIDETIAATQTGNYEIVNSNPLLQFSDLGELQSGYQLFQNQFLLTKQTLESGYFQKKKNALVKDLQYLAALKNNTYQQQQLSAEDQQLLEKEYKAYEKLAEEKVIAPLELNQYKSKLIAKEQSLKQTGSQITNNDISSHGKQKELLDLQKTVTDQQQQFHSSLLDLKSEMEKWIQQYVLVASEDGKALFVSSLQENELISAGQGLFYIEPKQTKFYAELMAAQKGFGKINTGQKVMIKVESYPSTEFGYLTGSVSYISNMPNRRDSFLVKVNLPKGLQTNYDKTIFFRNNLSAQAEVVTDSRRLFDRLAGQLKQIWER